MVVSERCIAGRLGESSREYQSEGVVNAEASLEVGLAPWKRCCDGCRLA